MDQVLNDSSFHNNSTTCLVFSCSHFVRYLVKPYFWKVCLVEHVLFMFYSWCLTVSLFFKFVKVFSSCSLGRHLILMPSLSSWNHSIVTSCRYTISVIHLSLSCLLLLYLFFLFLFRLFAFISSKHTAKITSILFLHLFFALIFLNYLCLLANSTCLPACFTIF